MSKVTQYVRHLAVVAIATIAAQFGRAEGDELNYTWRDGWNADPTQTVTYGAYTGENGIMFANQQMGIVAQVKLVSNVSANVISYTGDWNNLALATNAEGKYTLTSNVTSLNGLVSETAATTGWHRYSMLVRRGPGGGGHAATVIILEDGNELFKVTDGTNFAGGPFKTLTIGGTQGNLAKGGHWSAHVACGNADSDATQIEQIEADCVKMYPPVDESVVAKIGETGYQTLDEAMTYATENATAEAPITVKLLAPHTGDVAIPENVTVEMNVDNRIVGAVSGAGTVKLLHPTTATQGNLATWIGEGKMTLGEFTGTVHLAAGRFNATAALVPATAKVKVTNGAQLFLDGGTWTNTIEIEGAGYGAETGAIGRAALRFENGNIDGATIVTTGTGDNAPAIGSHNADRTFACTISGSGDLRLVQGMGTHTYTLTNNSFTGALTVVDANLTAKGTFTNNAIKGAGTVIFDGKLPTAANALNSDAWTGTAWIKNYQNAVLFRDAQAYGKIRMTNVTGCWLYNGRPDQTSYTLELVDEGENVALNLKENSEYHFYFSKLTGSGTLSITQTDARKRRYSFADVSEFTGKIAHASANSTIILGANEDVQRQGDVVIKAPVTLASIAVPEGKNVVLAAEAATLTVPAELDAGVVTTTVSGKKVVFDDETKTYSLADLTATELFLEGIAAGGDVELTGDVTLDATAVIPADKTVTLDLNGCTITAPKTVIEVLGTLTVKDTGTNGKIVSIGHCGIVVGDGATLTVNSGIIESVEGAIITGKAVGATITINGGTFSASDNAVIAGNGSAREGDRNEIMIYGGTFNGTIKSAGYIACGIYAPWKDAILVAGGTFNITGGCGICARAGTIEIREGVTIKLTNEGTVSGWVGDNKNAVPGVQAFFDYAAKYPGLAEGDAIFSDVNTLTIAETQEWVVASPGYKLVDKPQGPKDWTDVTESTTLDQVAPAEQVAALTAAGATATQVAAWATKVGINGKPGVELDLDALALDCSPSAKQQTVEDEVPSIDMTELAKGDLTAAVKAISDKYPLATVQLVEATLPEGTVTTAKLYKLSIAIKK